MKNTGLERSGYKIEFFSGKERKYTRDAVLL